jgi:hypothetical protein
MSLIRMKEWLRIVVAETKSDINDTYAAKELS